MKLSLLFLLPILAYGNILVGQTLESSKFNSVCFNNDDYKNNSISSFKDELTLKLDITTIEIDKTTERISFSHSEKIRNESSLILINDTVAFKISIGRVVEFDVKKYLYKAILFRKQDDCWRAASLTNYWNEFYPGIISSGFGFGYEGTYGYMGFTGSLLVE